MNGQSQPFVDHHPDVPQTALQAEQTRLLYAGIPVSLAVNALIAAVLVAVQSSELDIEPITEWCALLGATLVLRAVFTTTYRRAHKDELASAAWLTRFRIGTATTGIAWGLASFLLFPASNIPHLSFLALAIAGMTAGAVTSLSIDLVSTLAFIIPALVPLIARLLAEGGEMPFAMGTMATLYLAALILNVQRTHTSIRENICLRLEAVAREHVLRESKERLKLIMETTDDVFWMADVPIESMLYISPACERVWGRSAASLYANPRSFIEAIHPEDTERVLANLEAKKTGLPFDHEYRIVRPDGSVRWVWDRGFPIRDKTGKVMRYAGIAQDITERKQMEQQLRNLAAHLQTVREEEKAGIAREIHDEMGGTLTALKMETYSLAEALSANKAAPPLLEHVDRMAQLTDSATSFTRRIISGLRPPVLDDFGLLAAIEWEAGQFHKRTGIECRVNCVGDNNCKKELDKAWSISLFRIFQESLTNISLHSGASRVEVEFHHSDTEIMLSISDNGHGMQEHRVAASASYGLQGMRERVEQLGGTIKFGNTVNIGSTAGGGFSVVAVLPLPAGNSKGESA